MVAVRTDNGTKYAQEVVQATPNYVLGGVRMEDSHAVTTSARATVICVADGHGSVKVGPGVFLGGRECADAACGTAIAIADRRPPEKVFAACQESVSAVRLAGTSRELFSGGAVGLRSAAWPGVRFPLSGTTLSVCVVVPNGASWFSYVGDSLGVLARRDGSVLHLGDAHGTRNPSEVARAVAAGGVVDGNYFAMSVGNTTHRAAVSRALGHFGNAMISATPETVRFLARPGDRLVVASDGLWDAIKRDAAAAILLKSVSEADACTQLLAAARAKRGARDNVTICCHFVSESRSEACCVVQ